MEPLGGGVFGSPNPDPLSFFTTKLHPFSITFAINLLLQLFLGLFLTSTVATKIGLSVFANVFGSAPRSLFHKVPF